MANKPTSDVRIVKLRDQMKKHGVDGYIIPNTDMYNNEYVPDSEQRLSWLTDFTGSAGSAVVLNKSAGFFTDSRYTIQAGQQVPTVFFDILNSHKAQDSDPAPVPHFIANNAKSGQVIGFDPRLISVQEAKTLTAELAKLNISVKPIEQNLIDTIWQTRPAEPQSIVTLFDDMTAGRTAADKRKVVADIVDKDGCDGALITMTDSVAWLLNIRGTDVGHVPIALSTALIHKDGQVDWFIDPARVPQNVQNHLGSLFL